MLGGVLIFEGCSEDYLYRFLFFLFEILLFLYMGLVTIIDIHCTYLLYICWYMFLSPTLTCIVSFLSLYTCFSLLVCNLLFLFHTKMSWWVLFKVFQKYRLSKSTCQKLSSYTVFQEFVLGYILLYSTSEYELSDLWLLSYFICLLWFCHRLPNGEIVKLWFPTMLCWL